MSSEPHNFDPGCFGYLTTFDQGDDYCQQCNQFEPCGEKAIEARAKLEKLIMHRDIDVKLPMITTQESELPAVAEEAVEVAAETVTDGVATPPMSKKAAELDRSLRKKGVMWSNFSRGISPLEYINIVGDVTTFGPQYAQIILRKLVRSGELKVRDIQTALVDELNWKDSTARSHIAIMQSLLVHYGYIKIDGDKWVLVK